MADNESDFKLDRFYMTPEKADEYLRKICEEADSIIVPGAKCTVQGGLEKQAEQRCEGERAFKSIMKNYKKTIVSGGRRGVPPEYQKIDPHATEASLMIARNASKGEDPRDYIAEEHALETIGNIVFSARLLLFNNPPLIRPLFISEFGHLAIIEVVADRWFGESGISPFFWPWSGDLNYLNNSVTQSFIDRRQGMQYYIDFIMDNPPLGSGGWEENAIRFERAVTWLFENATDLRTNTKRYLAAYSLNILLTKLT